MEPGEDFEITPSLTDVDSCEEQREPPPSYEQSMIEAMVASGSQPGQPSTSGAVLYPSLPVTPAPGGPPCAPGEASGPLTNVTFTQGPFNSLVEQANAWLEQHPEYEVVNCETLELPRENDGCSFGDSISITDVSSFNLRLASNVQFIRVFRLWIVPQSPGKHQKPQRISYLDITPKKRQTSCAAFFLRPKVEFESMKDTLLRYNHDLRTEPLAGRLMCAQTLDILYRDETKQNGAPPSFERFQENYFSWVREKSDSPEYFRLSFLRVYFDENQSAASSAIQQIGFKDFVPKQSEDGKDFFEPMQPSSVRIQSWLNERDDLDITNIQTVHYSFNKAPNAKFTADTDRTLFKLKDTGDLRQLRFFRAYFVQYIHPDPTFQRPSRPLAITYKAFNPALTSRLTKTQPERFESNNDAWRRSSCWLRATGARVFGAETVLIRTYPAKGNSNLQTPYVLDSSFRDNRGSDWNETWVLAHRVFLDGVYPEPPASMLPPLPNLPPEDSNSCTIL